ncbi:putative serine/threonine-protein kinase PBL3 [Canna indica]|uniref:non-specific serine/threonine protein kinase n=1 Tax=Canna indica TaxID=4628 RepID=A0AAQ3QE46_9LILI|nr:putative serine/threonine-protein kinase PBL3 [Canna indica]
MGNCLNPPSSVEDSRTSQNSSYPSKVVTSRASSLSVPSSRTTCSTPSTLTIPSYSEKNSSGDLPTPRTEGQILSASNSKDFTYSELKSATRNFRPENLIGEGGFGYVYKGWVDEQSLAPSKPGHGMIVAIKKLKRESFQGHKEWLTEVNYLGQLQHPNLVKLIGYCSEGDNRLLVYEYVARGNLENHLFRRSAQPLDWQTRIKVAIGTARGISFLHDSKSQVIYRDVKASNILLDPEFNAKLSDFGLAKAGPTGDRTHISTQVMGTQGYAAPEYIATGRLSARADVYSFGVVLLELLTGRRALDRSRELPKQNLADWVRPWLTDKRKLHKIIDPKLGEQYPKRGAHALAQLASRCISNDAKRRPPMSEVLTSLEQLQDPKFAFVSPRAKEGKSSASIPRSSLRFLVSHLHPSDGGNWEPISHQ